VPAIMNGAVFVFQAQLSYGSPVIQIIEGFECTLRYTKALLMAVDMWK
jgi:hypothetical protein